MKKILTFILTISYSTVYFATFTTRVYAYNQNLNQYEELVNNLIDLWKVKDDEEEEENDEHQDRHKKDHKNSRGRGHTKDDYEDYDEDETPPSTPNDNDQPDEDEEEKDDDEDGGDDNDSTEEPTPPTEPEVPEVPDIPDLPEVPEEPDESPEVPPTPPTTPPTEPGAGGNVNSPEITQELPAQQASAPSVNTGTDSVETLRRYLRTLTGNTGNGSEYVYTDDKLDSGLRENMVKLSLTLGMSGIGIALLSRFVAHRRNKLSKILN